MINYLGHHFVPINTEESRNPWFWVYCTQCNIGAWYSSNFLIEIRTMHEIKNTLMRPQFKEHITCEEYIIKKLLE
jgi:hypothetical protein